MNQNPWISQTLADIGYAARVRLGENDCFVEVEAYELVNAEGEPAAYQTRDARIRPTPTANIEEAERFLSGSIRFDGCSNLLFDENANGCMLHFCDKARAVAVGTLLGRLYDMARETLPRPDWEVSA